MAVRIQKWGNSLGLRIPKEAARAARLSAGSEVEVEAANGRLIVRPRRRKAYDLRGLLRGVRRGHIHGELDWGPARGREAW